MSVKTRIKISMGDITELNVDVIVNAANSALCGGGGVDGAIHHAAGPGLLAECRQLTRLPAGGAVLTGGHDLKASYIIHAVGPVWEGGHQSEAELLASCYQRSLEIAAGKECDSIAFPSISCGAYGFPIKQAASIAYRTVEAFLQKNDYPREVIHCCFTDNCFKALKDVEKSQD